MKKFTNVKVSLEFNDLLSAHSLFQGADYKLISPCHYLLNRVHRDCVLKKCEYAPIHSEWIQDLFQTYRRAAQSKHARTDRDSFISNPTHTGKSSGTDTGRAIAPESCCAGVLCPVASGTCLSFRLNSRQRLSLMRSS